MGQRKYVVAIFLVLINIALALPASAATANITWKRCANENETCSFSGSKKVRYGLENIWTYKTVSGPVDCSNEFFGDPYDGADKVCDYMVISTSSVDPKCSISATSTSIMAGKKIILAWSSTGATRAVLSQWTSSLKVVPNSRRLIKPPVGNNTYTLTVSGRDASSTCSINIRVSERINTTPVDSITTAPVTPLSSSPATSASQTTNTWTKCANEYGVCNVSGTRLVRYGLGDKWITKTVSGPVDCSNEFFGDPYVWADKICEYSNTTSSTPTTTTPPATTPSTPSAWTFCSNEHGTCNFTGTKVVRYGLEDKWAIKTISGPVYCNNDVFGDPYVGANKICEYSSQTISTTPTTPTTTPSAPTTTPTPSTPSSSTPSPYGQNAGDYELTFADEFDGFNTNIWNDSIWYEVSHPTKNYTVEDGKLKIWPQRDASGKFFNRTIDSDGKWYQTYGYFEIEAKLPAGKGTWPGFWLFNHINERRPEMDIMEAYGGWEAPWSFVDSNGVHRPQSFAPTVWKGDYDGQRLGTRTYDTNSDLSKSFHKYAVKWEPNKQTYYYDGVEILTVNATFSDRMYLLFDLWFGSISGDPDEKTPEGKSNSFEINYVRAWKFK